MGALTLLNNTLSKARLDVPYCKEPLVQSELVNISDASCHTKLDITFMSGWFLLILTQQLGKSWTGAGGGGHLHSSGNIRKKNCLHGLDGSKTCKKNIQISIHTLKRPISLEFAVFQPCIWDHT